MSKVNKFEASLSATGASIRKLRATAVAADAKDAQEEVLRGLNKEKRQLEQRVAGLQDIHRDSEITLKVVKDHFDPDEWAENLQNAKVALLNKNVEIKVAMETYNEWFVVAE